MIGRPNLRTPGPFPCLLVPSFDHSIQISDGLVTVLEAVTLTRSQINSTATRDSTTRSGACNTADPAKVGFAHYVTGWNRGRRPPGLSQNHKNKTTPEAMDRRPLQRATKTSPKDQNNSATIRMSLDNRDQDRSGVRRREMALVDGAQGLTEVMGEH